MRVKTYGFAFAIFLQTACLGVLNVSFDNVWEVPGTDLEIAVYKEKTVSKAPPQTVERRLVLRENHSDRATFNLRRTGDNFSRVNVYRTAADVYLIRDAFDAYELNARAKTLRKITPTDAGAPEYVGTFDANQHGNLRYIPATERAEIPLGTN